MAFAGIATGGLAANACGGDSATIGGDPDASAADGTTQPPSDGAAPDGAAGADARSPQDAGAGADAPDNSDGAARSLACGAHACDGRVEVCCPNVDGGTCFAQGTAPGSCDAYQCYGAADCASGLVCCFQGHHGCGFGSVCAATCIEEQLCLGNAECVTGTCAPHTCGGAAVKACQTRRCCQ